MSRTIENNVSIQELANWINHIYHFPALWTGRENYLSKLPPENKLDLLRAVTEATEKDPTAKWANEVSTYAKLPPSTTYADETASAIKKQSKENISNLAKLLSQKTREKIIEALKIDLDLIAYVEETKQTPQKDMASHESEMREKISTIEQQFRIAIATEASSELEKNIKRANVITTMRENPRALNTVLKALLQKEACTLVKSICENAFYKLIDAHLSRTQGVNGAAAPGKTPYSIGDFERALADIISNKLYAKILLDTFRETALKDSRFAHVWAAIAQDSTKREVAFSSGNLFEAKNVFKCFQGKLPNPYKGSEPNLVHVLFYLTFRAQKKVHQSPDDYQATEGYKVLITAYHEQHKMVRPDLYEKNAVGLLRSLAAGEAEELKKKLREQMHLVEERVKLAVIPTVERTEQEIELENTEMMQVLRDIFKETDPTVTDDYTICERAFDHSAADPAADYESIKNAIYERTNAYLNGKPSKEAESVLTTKLARFLASEEGCKKIIRAFSELATGDLVFQKIWINLATNVLGNFRSVKFFGDNIAEMKNPIKSHGGYDGNTVTVSQYLIYLFLRADQKRLIYSGGDIARLRYADADAQISGVFTRLTNAYTSLNAGFDTSLYHYATYGLASLTSEFADTINHLSEAACLKACQLAASFLKGSDKTPGVVKDDAPQESPKAIAP